MNRHTKEVTIGGQKLVFETGRIARQANGAVVLTVGETMLFSSACAKFEAPTQTEFLPLRVDYQEKFSSAGKTAGGYIKREGRLSEREILLSRLIDRPIRPMFEDGFYNEVQLLTYVWSSDGLVNLDPMAICCSAAALVVSDIPFIKPVGAVRVGMIDGIFKINPSHAEMENSKLDLVLAGTEDAVLMIEGYCDFLTEEQVLEAIELGHQNIRFICHALEEWRQECGKEKIRNTLTPLSKEVINEVESIAGPKLPEALAIADKQAREEAIGTIKTTVLTTLFPEGEEEPRFSETDVNNALKKVQSKYMREMILSKGVRSDGRGCEEIRPITIEQNLLPRAHGSSLFTRGETQTLAVCTLGGESMAQRYEFLHNEGAQRFYMQYFFPPFSVGEVGRMGPPGRREVGHGKLAEKALFYAIPDNESFPYIIRLESNITESNGSSSMASVCGGCLAMMDAGVPIKRPVSGIAMGLILEDNRHTILSDILGIEDALGDMDFKITGDQEGITAFQMDIKVEGITVEIMRSALAQAKKGRIHILSKMLEVCPTYRKQMSQHAPRIETVRISPSKIATVIGPGGKQIRAIIEETGVDININDDGVISIASPNAHGIDRAKQIIEGLTAEVEIGRVYQGRVTGLAAFGCFVEILPGKEGLCHISEFNHEHIKNMTDVVKEGDTISVKVLDITERGQLKLSRKATLAKPPKAEAPKAGA